jgi:hypothetical protein
VFGLKLANEWAYAAEVAGVTARVRLRFWRSYLGTEKRLAAWWLQRMVLMKWRRYRRHNDKKRAA